MRALHSGPAQPGSATAARPGGLAPEHLDRIGGVAPASAMEHRLGKRSRGEAQDLAGRGARGRGRSRHVLGM